MSDNIAPGERLPMAVFDPQPDLETQPKNLIKVGIFISSSAFSAMLRPKPPAIMMSHIHIQYAYSVARIMIFLFGVGMIGIGWLVADNPMRYTTLGTIVTRVSHIMLVFAVALRKVASTSSTHADTSNN